MDVCCYNRPFDDLSQERVYIESAAVLVIISHCKQGALTLIGSEAIDRELANLLDKDRFDKIQTLYSAATERLEITAAAEERSSELQLHGIKKFDSLHVALAEMCGALFLTTDDRLLRAVNRLGCKAYNPTNWIMEVQK